MNEMNDKIEINLLELFEYLKKRIGRIIIFTLVCMIVVAAVTIFLIPEKYTSTARIFPKMETSSESGTVTDTTSISVNTSMINNYVELIGGTSILGEVADQLGMERSEIQNSISVSNETDTMIISISATTMDPKLSKEIVDTTIDVFYEEIKEKLDVDNMITVDKAEVPTSPSSPNFIRNVAISGLVGIVISCGYYFIKFMMDTRIHTKEEAEKYFEIPVLGVIPYFEDK
ncbi:MAG: Wzz/FepE/Etk N-terminal domain-containing protein [Erysipelotrichaceae bacterium]|nr:Wzz/FepE/Etk N-terminal domain-containing protein [Erysipelotrichaceae bacterium]